MEDSKRKNRSEEKRIEIDAHDDGLGNQVLNDVLHVGPVEPDLGELGGLDLTQVRYK